MQKAKITVIAVEYSPITGTKIVEKEIAVAAIALHDEETNRNTQRAKTIDAQFKELKKQNAQRAKAIAHTKQR